MRNSKAGAWKKIMLILTCFAVISTIPSSFADELIQTITQTITETITEVITDPAPTEDLPAEEIPVVEEPAAEPQVSPSPIPTDLGKTTVLSIQEINKYDKHNTVIIFFILLTFKYFKSFPRLDIFSIPNIVPFFNLIHRNFFKLPCNGP